MFALISDGAVVQVSASEFEVHDTLSWVDISTVTPEPAAGWTYDGAVFHAPVVPSVAVDWPAQARAALDISDTTILRCYENAVAVPPAWATYRAALRAIVAGEAVTALPARPAYPAGT